MAEKCICCELPIKEIIKEYGNEAVEDGYHLEKGFLCYPCAEYDLSEPPLTVFHNRDEYPRRVGNYISDYLLEGEEPPFGMEWVPSDAWRGHYEVKHNGNLVKIFDDSILSYHESEVMLKALHDIALKTFDLTGIDYYRVFSRTSNVFCMNMDIFIDKNKEQLGNEIIELTKKFVNYDNPIFSTGILFPRDQPADFKLGNTDAVINSEGCDAIKQFVISIGQEILNSE